MAILKTLPGLPGARFQLADVYASVGRYSEAADVLRGIPSGSLPPGAVEEAVRLLVTAPPQAASPQTILRRTALGFIYLYVGASDRVLDFYEGLAEAGNLGSPGASHLWAPSYAPVCKTERSKNIVRALGYVDYWRARGWPEFCHPTTGDNFACE